MKNLVLFCLSFAGSVQSIAAWVSPASTSNIHSKMTNNKAHPSTTQISLMMPEAATSLLAGSIAGAVGVGVAFPLDTLKTKQQVEMESSSRIDYTLSPNGALAVSRAAPLSLLETIVGVFQEEGIGGFYGGVRTSMAGQAIIKATAFSVNTAVLHSGFSLVAAAATAGLVTAFFAVPVDRIKVLMQTDSYESELECFEAVIESEGVKGLLTTGLLPTLFREVPAYTLYFYLYGMLMSSGYLGTASLGPLAPLIDGAVAGACCVVPVHPVDVVKTIVQHSASEWQDVVSEIYEGRGMEGFWEGLSPRMSRAAINHSVTFAAYDFLMHSL